MEEGYVTGRSLDIFCEKIYESISNKLSGAATDMKAFERNAMPCHNSLDIEHLKMEV